MSRFKEIINFIKKQFPERDFIPLHEPVFRGNERNYVLDAIDSTYVSSVGKYVDRFEEMMAEITGTRFAVATSNGTSALHMCLVLADVVEGSEVITQSLTFVATLNSIAYTGARPIFLDVDTETMGLSPKAVKDFLIKNGKIKGGQCFNSTTGKRIAACVPMHTFGHSCKIDEIVEICKEWNIPVVEDAAESLGSLYKNKHTGGFGILGAFSFNGNKTVTCGGGGAIVTNNEELARKAKHLTTQAKVSHAWEYNHDAIGYNYRMPNLNAAMACGQLEMLDDFLASKRELASIYHDFFKDLDSVKFINEPMESRSNYWLNTIQLRSEADRNEFLRETNSGGVMTRPIWKLTSQLPMYDNCQNDGLTNSLLLSETLVNIPSSVRQ